MVTSDGDIHAEDVKAALRKKFGSLRRFERLYRIPGNSASAALRRPHRMAESAIIKALGVRGNMLWPERYASNGRRLTVQPPENYGRTAGVRK